MTRVECIGLHNAIDVDFINVLELPGCCVVTVLVHHDRREDAVRSTSYKATIRRTLSFELLPSDYSTEGVQWGDGVCFSYRMIGTTPKLLFATAVTIVGSIIIKTTTFNNHPHPLIPSYFEMNVMSTAHHRHTSIYHNLPLPQVPLDVENYQVAPPELSLEQVHVFVRHGTYQPLYLHNS